MWTDWQANCFKIKHFYPMQCDTRWKLNICAQWESSFEMTKSNSEISGMWNIFVLNANEDLYEILLS